MDDKGDDAAALVLLVVIGAAAIAASSARLRADNENQLTVTNLNFDPLLASPRFDGWFRDNLRCSQKHFVRLCEIFRPHASTSLLHGREHSFEKKMALLLQYLASSGSMKDAGLALGISKPHAVGTINVLPKIICGQAKVFIRMPINDVEWREVMDGFGAVRGFPYVSGAVDGSLFEIARPAEYEGWYCKDFYPAINMQAICDAHRRYMDYDMRPGSYSDKKTWKASTIGRSVQNVLHRGGGGHFIADGEYTLSCELLTPYIPREEGGKLSRQQEYYNYIRNASRMAIECAFGMLKQRFRLIRRQFDLKPNTNCTRCIFVVMVLHNLLIDFEDDTISRNELDDPSVMVLEVEPSSDKRDICRAKRDDLAQLFYPRTNRR